MSSINQQAKAVSSKKQYIFEQLTRINDEVKGANLTAVDADVQLSAISKYEDAFEKIIDDTYLLNAQLEKDDQLKVRDFDTIRTLIDANRKLCLKAKLKNEPIVNDDSSYSSDVKLPRVSIPTWDGDVATWMEFKALFDAIIHTKKDIKNIVKLQYLRVSLKNEPLSIVSQYPLTDDSYQLAYKDLTDRYQNTRRIASYYLHQILSYENSMVEGDREHIRFIELHRAATSALTSLGISNLSDYILFEISYNNLSKSNQKLFDRNHGTQSVPNLKDLLTFVESIAQSEELCFDKSLMFNSNKGQNTHQRKSPTKPNSNSSTSRIKKSFITTNQNQTKTSCYSCNENHPLFRCPHLISMSVPKRRDHIQQLGVCISCLYRHPGKECRSKYCCKFCGSKQHNSLIHENQPTNQASESLSQPSTSAAGLKTCINCTASNISPVQVLLGTLQCCIKDIWGNLVEVRAVLDPCSEVSIITTSLAYQLGFPKRPALCEVQGIANGTTKPQGIMSINLYHSKTKLRIHKLSALILPTICSQLPRSNVPTQIWRKFQNIELADQEFHISNSVQMLLGADVYDDLLCTEDPAIILGPPSAIRTKFGYVIIGRIKTACNSSNLTKVSSFHITTSPLDTALTRFWETEEVAVAKAFDPADDVCEQHFKDTHSRDVSGRFIIRLPFLPDAPPLGDNQISAIKCLARLERRLAKNPSLSLAYGACLSEYIQLGHMSPRASSPNYLLPHHAVIKESSSTTKVRVVFNCSSRDNHGLSLNDRLYKGPALLSDISSLLISFRLHKVCVVSDIKMMYRMIVIHPQDRKNLTIMWRSDQYPHQFYQMNRLTFGLKPAGYLASRCVLELAYLHESEYPAAAKTIYQNRYMDDFCTGADSIEAASQLITELTQLLAKGGFEIRRWSSNNPDALSKVSQEFMETPVTLPSGEMGVKVLGVMWEQKSDSFIVQVRAFDAPIITKRALLSYIARIYDVMGFFCPTIFLAKHFMQRLWLLKSGWDQPLPEHLAEEWRAYATELVHLSEIKIPRYLPINNSQVRLVGFSDASEKGMAAVAYLQLSSSDANQVQGYFLKAKSKLAPLKILTIPRLELCGALLLAKLIKSVIDNINLKFNSVNLYTDSKVVLAWLAQPPYQLKTFVGNRVAQIHQYVPDAIWGHVVGTENPADLGSRGVSAGQLRTSELWWHGPKFLELDYIDWPGQPENQFNFPDLPETKPRILINQIHNQLVSTQDEIIVRFSSFTRMQRVLGYVRRFIFNARNRFRPVTGPLTVSELGEALLTAVRISQQQDFCDAIQRLKANKLVGKQLQKLSPFFELQTGLLRVGGRLSRATFLPEYTKHPILLSKNCHLSALICNHYHRLNLHSGPRATCASIQRKFWILSIMSLVKKIIYRCEPCRRLNARPNQPIMADVLPDRMQQTYCWASCAIDFGGPFTTKESNLRKGTTHRTYMCVFVCLTTRAIHLEMVTDLTAKAFLAAFQRFTARRSVPNVIYSDRGTNFTAARSELKECQEFLKNNHELFLSTAAAVGTRWLLNAPYGPNFNGCAENGVKSAKSLIKRQVGEQVLTFEEFATLLCRVEQVLNSRPISFQTMDINDQEIQYITPGHFITGREMMTPAEEPIQGISFRDRWTKVQQMAQNFWKVWSKAYLHELMSRKKWTKATSNLKIGDLVYLIGVGTSPLSWPIGRVEETFSNADESTVRVARVRTRGRSFIRPVSKLVVIPTQE